MESNQEKIKTDTELKTDADTPQLEGVVIPPAKKQIPNCYDCKHCRDLEYDAHKECKHPLIGEADRLITILCIERGKRSGVMRRLNISGNEHGIKKRMVLLADKL